MLLASFIQGNHQLLASALDDHLHQPFRAPLCPLLPAIQELAGKFGILGAVLSGAGPSVLVFLHPKAAAISSKAEVSSHLRKRGLAAELILTSIAERGARDSVSFRRK
jgi:homoserine kinase